MRDEDARDEDVQCARARGSRGRLTDACTYQRRWMHINDQETLQELSDDIVQVRNASDVSSNEEMVRAWDQWDETRTATLRMDKSSRTIQSGFYPIGHDALIDLVDGWGPFAPQSPFKLDQLSLGQLSEIAFLFGGVGDGRHVLSTLCGLHVAYRELDKKKRKKFHAHFTLLDIHGGMLARDISILLLIDQLTRSMSATARAEINATLMYTFCGVVMPSYCYDRMQVLWKDLEKRLSATPPDLPTWLHVAPEAIGAVLQVLKFWINEQKSTKELLDRHAHMTLQGRLFQQVGSLATHADDANDTQEKISTRRERLKQHYLAISDEELMATPFGSSGQPIAHARVLWNNVVDKMVDKALKERTPELVPLEHAW
ncbi:uncharacterized protein BXZ73DRAFT_80940 [Epithele typhae]|uniref:uncharacterized protein n=1 Tax=Epithele typhae TaxID=378194 RepID=UPI0020078703|nr:uncharacterized protein BXZ73DRAFT_80940 [Epithele typhae]KAH9916972.1 hypothetical protein BXZ73DRAFT_80940 [Epithele typhae]